VNPSCTGLIGSGVVVHLPSFFKELEALETQGMHPLTRTMFVLKYFFQALIAKVVFSSPIVLILCSTFIKSLTD
jgi:hypothetical protein